MAPEPEKAGKVTYRLPEGLTGPADVARLGRELEALDDYLRQAAVRQPGVKPKLPKTTRLFSDLAALNRFDLLDEGHRRKLAAVIEVLRTRAPVLHISFSVEPSSAFVAKLVTWLRGNISPFALVTIGKQPTIGGGCVVRTANRQFDFSFRQYLHNNRQVLADALAQVAAK